MAASLGLHAVLVAALLRTGLVPAPPIERVIDVTFAPPPEPPLPPPPPPKPDDPGKSAAHAAAPRVVVATSPRPPPKVRRTPVVPTEVKPRLAEVAETPEPAPPEPQVSAAELASALTAEGDGASGEGGSGGGSDRGGCGMVRRLQAALRSDARVRAAAAEAHRETGRPILVWNGDWVRRGAEEGKGLAGVRQAIAVEVAFAPKACRDQPMRGLVLLSLADAPGAPRIVLGEGGAWRWSDLLF